MTKPTRWWVCVDCHRVFASPRFEQRCPTCYFAALGNEDLDAREWRLAALAGAALGCALSVLTWWVI